MGSSNSVSEYHSKWKNVAWCACGTSHFRAIEIDWRSHKMMNGAAEAGLHVVRGAVAVATLGISTVFNGGIAKPLHHAVLVIFVCDKCGGGEYWGTYELSTKGKEFNSGYYHFYRRSLCSKKINVPFSTVHEIYEAMSNGYCAVNWNCIRFARRFYWEVYRANEERVQRANPPISKVLSAHGRVDLVSCFKSIWRSGNTLAVESVVRVQFSDVGLDHISDAFVKGFNTKMICAKCANKLKNIDELCYCTEAADKCHHRNCCVRTNKEKLANLSITKVLLAHLRVDLVPCFYSILKSGNTKALESVKLELNKLGLDYISDAFVKGFNMKMICAKCAKKLHIDELCYCTEAADKCHHRNCCFCMNGFACVKMPLPRRSMKTTGSLSVSFMRTKTTNAEINRLWRWSRNSSAKKCGKQMHLDDICYCHKATTKCHCNARKCCDTKPEEIVRFY